MTVKRLTIKIPSIIDDEIDLQTNIACKNQAIHLDSIISIKDEIYIDKKPGSTICSSDDDIRWTRVTVWYKEQ